MEHKIILMEDNVEFGKELDTESYAKYLSILLSSMPSALIDVLSYVPLLRPACDAEHANHVYIFQDGELGKAENNLYKYRKYLYDHIVAVFNQTLQTAFPDITYIESCNVYNQEFCMDHTEEEVAERTKEVAEVSKYVREHFDEIIKESIVEDENNG